MCPLALRDCISALKRCLQCMLHGSVRDSAIGFGTYHPSSRLICSVNIAAGDEMNGLIYLVGLVVVIMFILSFLGLR